MLARKLRPSPIPDAQSGHELPVAGIHSARFRRLRVIIAVFSCLLDVVRMRLSGHLDRPVLFRRIRELIEQLSGLWVKIGQLASLRIDLLPTELCRELSKLQNRASGFPSALARELLERELGRPIDEVFEYFEDIPIAAASIGQVHRAKLKLEKTWVAVKIQRPYIAGMYERDLDLLRMAMNFLRFVGFMPHMRWHEVTWEVEQVMIEELDYRYEGSYAKRMRRQLKAHGVHAPKVFRRYTTKTLLVMEFVDGVLMSDYIAYSSRDPQGAANWCRENDVDPRALTVKLLDSLMRQVFEDNLFHGDLHPGNILVLRGGECCLIDFGTCGFSESAFMEKWRELFRTFGTRDFSRIVDIYFLICASAPNVDLREVREEIIQRVHEWKVRTGVPQLPFGEKSVDNIAVAITKILASTGFELGWAYLRLRRALASLDASVMELHPDIDYPKLSRQHFGWAFDRAARKAILSLPSETARAVGVTLGMARRLPDDFQMQMAAMRQQVQVLGGDIIKIGDLVFAMFKRVALAGAVLAAAVLLEVR